MTETTKTILIALLAGLAAVLLLASCQADSDHREKFNSWLSECIGMEGTPTLTHVQSNGANWYECMVGGKEVQIP